MGYVTTGATANPAVIATMVEKIFAGAKSQAEVDAKRPAFMAELKKRGIVAKPITRGQERIVFHDKLGVVVDGWVFRFPGKAA